VYGPVRTVVWEGRAGNRSPYPDRRNLATHGFPLYNSGPSFQSSRSWVAGNWVRAFCLLLQNLTGDPLIVVWNYGKGRSMAFASDIAPHWGAGFEQWKFYEQFWDQALNWLASR